MTARVTTPTPENNSVMNELIHPEVRAELKRLGVDDLPWFPADGGQTVRLQVWNDWIGFNAADSVMHQYDRDGQCVDCGTVGLETENMINLARARYSQADDKTPETPPTAFESCERLLHHLKPSNVSDTRRELLGGKDEVGLVRLAVMEGMPDYRKSTREKHAAICEVLVMLRETLARTGLTHADKDAVILAAAEKLEEAL